MQPGCERHESRGKTSTDRHLCGAHSGQRNQTAHETKRLEDNSSKDEMPVEMNDADSDIEGEDALGLQPIGSRDWSAIKKVMSKAEKRKWCVEQLESEQLRGSATDLVNVVQPFIDVLREVDSGQTFMGKIYHRLFTIQQQLKKKKRNGVVTGSLADKAIDILNEYWDKVHCPVMTVGYALDPEFIDVEQQSLEHLHDDCDQVGIDILGSMEQAKAAKREWLQIYKPVKSGTLAEGSEGEKNAKQMPAHEWWRLYMTAHCPTLAKLAVNVLAMSVAASPCEGIWSIFD